jgi:hypothetical protein
VSSPVFIHRVGTRPDPIDCTRGARATFLGVAINYDPLNAYFPDANSRRAVNRPSFDRRHMATRVSPGTRFIAIDPSGFQFGGNLFGRAARFSVQHREKLWLLSPSRRDACLDIYFALII